MKSIILKQYENENIQPWSVFVQCSFKTLTSTTLHALMDETEKPQQALSIAFACFTVFAVNDIY